MTETEVIRSMVLSFRLLELQTLLLFAGKSKLGKKNELQVREIDEIIYIMYNHTTKLSPTTAPIPNF